MQFLKDGVQTAVYMFHLQLFVLWYIHQNVLFVTVFLSVAWPTGVQLVFFFCSGVSRLFGAQGSPSSGSLLNL